MTESEKQSLYEAIRINAPEWYERTVQKLGQKKAVVSSCLYIAGHNEDDYRDEINRTYNSAKGLFNETETILLNYLCLVRHKEQRNGKVMKDDEEIRKWIGVLERFIDTDEQVMVLLEKQVRKTIDKYTVKAIGRPKGKGKRTFSYNGKEYRTIQECADDYGISKQGMHKKLRKLNII